MNSGDIMEFDSLYYAEEWLKQGHLKSNDQSQRRKTNLILPPKNKQDDNTSEDDI